MSTALSITVIVTSVLLIFLVLLHRSKGGGLSSMFGGGMSSQLSGSTVAEKNLNRMTIIIGLVWLAAVIALGLLLKV